MKTPTIWNQRVLNDTQKYIRLHNYWLSEQKGKVLVILYDQLQNNLRQHLHEIAKFLNVETSDEIIDCVIRNSEGNYHRRGQKGERDIPYEMLTLHTRKEVEKANEQVMKLVEHLKRNSSNVKVVDDR